MSGGKILVTGASGFIGSAVVKHLLAENRDVLPTARRNLDVLSQELGISCSKLDVMGELPDMTGVETIVHCATPNDIQSREADGGLPLAVMGTRRLLEKAAEQGVRRFVFLSTLQVYGTELSGEIDETTPIRCETPYGLNHYLGEEVCRYMAHRTGMDIVALRPSNVYGVPSVSTVNRQTLVPMCFVKEAQETGALRLRSSGRQMRNFVSTDEVAGIIRRLIDDCPKGYTIVNAVSGWGTTIRHIADIVGQQWQAVTHSPLEMEILSDHPQNPAHFTVTSRHMPPLLSEEESHNKMTQVVKQLIEMKTVKK